MKKILTLLAISLCLCAPAAKFAFATAPTEALDFQSKQACLLEYESGKIIYEKNASDRRPIASMVKIMTLLLCFEQIDKGTFSAEDTITISQNAASMGGSQAFLDAGSSYKIDDLLKSITIASANDSCVAMAEHISGSTEGFVASMNQKAASLGMNDTLFVNCTGLPAPNQYSSAKDVAIMTRELLKHSDYYKYSTIWLDELKHPSGRTTELANTNKLIRAYEGCDGGKTGFTNDAMFCLSSTAKRNGMRLICVIVGCPDSKVRFAENAKLLNYGFANFENKQVVFKGQTLKNEIEVAKSKIDKIKIAPQSDFFVFGARGTLKDNVVIREELEPNISAPIKIGDVVGKLVVEVDGEKAGEVNIVAQIDAQKRTFKDNLIRFFQKSANIA